MNDEVVVDDDPPKSRDRDLSALATLVAAILAFVAAGSGLAYNIVHDRSQSNEAAQGAARLLQSEFLASYCDLRSTVRRHRYPVARITVSTTIPSEERVHVAARMDRDGWEAVGRANVRVARAERLLARKAGDPTLRRNASRKQHKQDVRDLAAVNDYLAAFKNAFHALGGSDAADAFAKDPAARICP